MPDENIVPSAAESLETQAEAYLQAQEKLAHQSFNISTITIVLGLMPDDDNPQGRLGILSVRNDQDAPLFGTPLRGEELAPLLESPPIARLLTALKALLPERLKEREQKEKERQAIQPAPSTSTTKAKAGQKSGVNQTQVKAASEDSQMEVVATNEADPEKPVACTDGNPRPQTEPAPGKTTQLTLF